MSGSKVLARERGREGGRESVHADTSSVELLKKRQEKKRPVSASTEW